MPCLVALFWCGLNHLLHLGPFSLWPLHLNYVSIWVQIEIREGVSIKLVVVLAINHSPYAMLVIGLWFVLWIWCSAATCLSDRSQVVVVYPYHAWAAGESQLPKQDIFFRKGEVSFLNHYTREKINYTLHFFFFYARTCQISRLALEHLVLLIFEKYIFKFQTILKI